MNVVASGCGVRYDKHVGGPECAEPIYRRGAYWIGLQALDLGPTAAQRASLSIENGDRPAGDEAGTNSD